MQQIVNDTDAKALIFASREHIEITITDESGFRYLLRLRDDLTALVNDLEASRKTLVDPLNAHVKFINGEYKPIVEELNTTLKEVKSKILEYEKEQRAKELAAQAKQAALLAEAQNLKEAGNTTEAFKAAKEAVALTASEKRSDIRSEGGRKVVVKKRWTFAVEDFAAVPDKYKSLNNVAVNTDIRGGLRIIPGIKIYQEETLG